MKTERPHVGDSAWMVEWCTELAFYPDSEDIDRDSCRTIIRRVPSKEAAEQLAREVYPATVDKFGVVSYWPATFKPYDDADAIRYPWAGYWEATEDPEHYSGE